METGTIKMALLKTNPLPPERVAVELSGWVDKQLATEGPDTVVVGCSSVRTHTGYVMHFAYFGDGENTGIVEHKTFEEAEEFSRGFSRDLDLRPYARHSTSAEERN